MEETFAVILTDSPSFYGAGFVGFQKEIVKHTDDKIHYLQVLKLFLHSHCHVRTWNEKSCSIFYSW